MLGFGTRPPSSLACGILAHNMQTQKGKNNMTTCENVEVPQGTQCKTNSKSCALVGACEFNSKHFTSCCNNGMFDTIVAVDGGFKHLQNIDVSPSIAIGDFDSLGFVPKGVECIKHPCKKDKSDMELALDWACAEGFDAFYIYGAVGGRLDHTLANLQLFAKFSEIGNSVTAICETCAIRTLTGAGTFTIPANITAGTVSVFAAGDKAVGVCESGLEYSLNNATLTNRTSLGLSNELVGKRSTISVEKGTLYIFYPAICC